MKHVLLPTDFSINSVNAIRYALNFFRALEVEFFVIHVQKTSDYTTGDLMAGKPNASLYQNLLEDNQQKLNILIGQLKREFTSNNFKFEAIVDFDVFTDAINQAIRTFDIDLIVMGTNGASATKEKIFGSNTLQVIRHIKCPLITVPENYQYTTISKVLFSTGTESFSIKKMASLITILKMHNATLVVLKLNRSEPESRKPGYSAGLKELNETVNFEFYTISGISIPTAIDAFEQLHPIDLHAFFTKKESFLDRIIFGSDTSEISYGSKVPLLVMHKD